MDIAFIMDPLEKVNAKKDTTYMIMLAARQRGHRVFFLEQSQLFLVENKLFANVMEVDVHEDIEKPFSHLGQKETDLAAMDLVMVRTDPPFDQAYFYTTILLDLLPTTTRVLNRPSGLRNWNEKLASCLLPQFTPRTLVTQSHGRIRAFAESMGRITLKPIDGFAGKGIFFVEPDNPNFDQIIQMMTNEERRRIVAQEYIPAARDGDKRILLIDGEPMGAVLRLHPEGKELNNLDAGGSAHPTDLTQRDLEICRAIKPGLLEQGIFFAGIDIIGGFLIEVNVTSPTALQQLCQFSGVPHHHHLIEALEQGI